MLRRHGLETRSTSVCKNFSEGHRKNLINNKDKIQKQGNTMEDQESRVLHLISLLEGHGWFWKVIEGFEMS